MQITVLGFINTIITNLIVLYSNSLAVCNCFYRPLQSKYTVLLHIEYYALSYNNLHKLILSRRGWILIELTHQNKRGLMASQFIE